MDSFVRLQDAMCFLQKRLDIEMSERTLRKYLSSMGVGFCAAIVDGKDNVGLDDKESLYTEWIKDLRFSGSWQKLMCSLDFTYTSHRTAKPLTLAGRGRKTSVYSTKPRYTNCIITGVLSDGRQLDSIL